MRYLANGLSVALLILQAGAVSAITLDDDKPWFIELSAMYGQASGRMQTPAGGREGSVTPSEPRFDESGTLSTQLIIGRRLDKHLFYFSYRNWGMEGTDTYQSLPPAKPDEEGECVIIQNSVFCNGETVEARVDMQWFSLGYGYAFDFDFSNGGNLLVVPTVQADLYRFAMEIHRLEDQEWGGVEDYVDRRYNKGGLRVGGLLEYAQNDWLVWGSKLMTSIAMPSAPVSTDIELYAGFRLWDAAGSRGDLRVGVGYTYFRYTDQQTVPNDLIAQLGPSPLLALMVQF